MCNVQKPPVSPIMLNFKALSLRQSSTDIVENLHIDQKLNSLSFAVRLEALEGRNLEIQLRKRVQFYLNMDNTFAQFCEVSTNNVCESRFKNIMLKRTDYVCLG